MEPKDLSPRAISLARAIDRLPAGEYSIVLVKPEIEAKEWVVEINKMENLQNLVLKRRPDLML